MVNHTWLRPKTSSGLPAVNNNNNNTIINTNNNDDNDNDNDHESSSSSSPASLSSSSSLSSTSVLPSLAPSAANSARSNTTTIATSSTSNTSTTATSTTSSGGFPTDNAPSLSTRRSTHEFFSSARDTFNHHVASRPRPSSSYLIRSFGGPTHVDSSFSTSSSSSSSSYSTAAQRQPIGQPRSRFRLGIEEARGALSYMARKALHNSSGSRDMRPIDRLNTHDSTLSTVIVSSASSSTSSATSSSISSFAAPASTTRIAGAPSTRTSLPSVPTSPGSRPTSKSIRRLRSLRERASSRMFRSSTAREIPIFAQLNGSSGDAEDEQSEHDSQDVIMTNGPFSSHPWQQPLVGPGSAARAAAAEHNHGKATNHQDVFSSFASAEHRPQQYLHQHDDLDEDMSDDMRITKKRRGGHGKFASVVGEGDNGYDSMEIDNGVDEFTDRRRSKPPARTDLVGKLPTEIAAAILSYLDDTALNRCAKVSRRWNELASCSAVWRSSFLGRYARAEDNVLPYIQFGGQGLGRRVNQSQQWLKMSRARRQIEKNWRAGTPKAVYFVGHTDSVYCCQFDEDKIITGSRDRTIRVWDLNEPFQCRKVIGGPAARPVRPASDTPLETHPTNTVHQSQSLNGTPEGDAIYHVPSDYHTASILCLQFDKEIMVTGSSDHSCIVWDIKTFEPIRRLLHHTAGVLDVCMDDEYIISCSKDAHICVWDRKTYSLIKALHGHRGPVNAVQLREIGGRKLLVSASGDGLAKIWDLKKLEPVQQFNSQDRGLAAVEFSDDGKYVLAGGNDQVIYKFDSSTTNLEHTFRGHSSLVRSLFLDSANARVVSGSYDQGIRVYDFNNGDLIGSYDNWTTSWILAAKGDYRRIVATSQDGRALLMDFGWGVEGVEMLAGIDVPASPVSGFVPNYGGNNDDERGNQR